MNLLIAILVTVSMFAVTFEEGATFDEGICWEADGTEGVTMLDGQCMTPADYDAIYSFEALDATPSLAAAALGLDMSVAEYAGLVEDYTPASERLNGKGLVEEPEAFVGYVRRLHVFGSQVW